jgi:hypothetical protein
LYNQLKTDHLALIPFNVGAKGYTASVAHTWAVPVYHQFTLKSMEIPNVSVLYNQLKTDHLALIPFNVRAKGYTASVAHTWAVPVYHQFSLKSMEIPYVSVLYKQLKTEHLALIPFNLGATFKKRNNTYPPRCQLFLEYVENPLGTFMGAH